MRFIASLLILVLMVMLGGCQSVQPSTDPYGPLSALVQADDAVVKDATLAVKTGILPAKDAASIANAEQIVALGLPLAVQVAGQTGSPTAPNAVSLATINAEIGQLTIDVATLRSAVTGALAGVVNTAKHSATTQQVK